MNMGFRDEPLVMENSLLLAPKGRSSKKSTMFSNIYIYICSTTANRFQYQEESQRSYTSSCIFFACCWSNKGSGREESVRQTCRGVDAVTGHAVQESTSTFLCIATTSCGLVQGGESLHLRLVGRESKESPIETFGELVPSDSTMKRMRRRSSPSSSQTSDQLFGVLFGLNIPKSRLRVPLLVT